MQLVAEGKLGKGGAVLRKPRCGTDITKIKIKGEKITIISELPPEDTETKILTFVCEEQPKKSFHAALKLIFNTLVNLCGLDSKIWETGTISSISLKDTEDGLDVAIALQLELDEGAIATTYKQKDISLDLRDEINNFLAEVEDYIKGDRAVQQLSLLKEE